MHRRYLSSIISIRLHEKTANSRWNVNRVIEESREEKGEIKRRDGEIEARESISFHVPIVFREVHTHGTKTRELILILERHLANINSALSTDPLDELPSSN